MESKKQGTNRRDFLKFAAVSGVAAATLNVPLAASAADKASEADPVSKALCFHNNAAKVNAKAKGCEKRAAADGATQFCWNCSFYQAGGKDPKSLKEAACPILQNKLVPSAGWCNAWVKNPKAV